LKNFRKPFKREELIPFNHFIRSPNVLCINQADENLGVMRTDSALELAANANLDLVQISMGKNNVPICKITDFGKFKFNLSKKKKEQDKKKRESTIKIKEIAFRPGTDENDLNIKANKAIQFLNDKDNLKVTVVFKRSELNHKDIGITTLKSFISKLGEIEFINEPSFAGKSLTTLVKRK